MVPFLMIRVTPNPDFKVTRLFNAISEKVRVYEIQTDRQTEGRTDGHADRHSYNKLLIWTYALLKNVISHELE